MENVQLKRGKNRIIGGVCSALAEKYKIEPWLLRVGLIILSFYFYYAILAYVIAWTAIPNEIRVESKEQNRLQAIGLIVGGLLGALVFGGFTFATAIILNDPAKGGVGPVLLAFMGIPVGMVIGFSMARINVENKALKKTKQTDSTDL